MTDSDLLDELLLEWDDGRRAGKEIPEDRLCRERPDLLGELRRRIAALRATQRLADMARDDSAALYSARTVAGIGVGGSSAAVVNLPSAPPGATSGWPAGANAVDRPAPADQSPAAPTPAAPQARTELAPGTRIGRYVIVGLLGRGGMGEVYEAEDTVIGRRIALKRLSATAVPAADRAARERFLAEVRAAGRLEHPNLVPVYEVAEHDGDLLMATPLLTGGSADKLIAGGKRAGWEKAGRIIADVCRGLAAAHAAGVIHRDIKPANILLAADGSARLADFGLAKSLDPAASRAQLTAAGVAVGTAAYMSPEQWNGDPVDGRADLYSLGATYFALLAGRPPFDPEKGVLSLVVDHGCRPVPDVRQFAPDAPAGCQAVIDRAMAKAPADRFTDAFAMLAALDNISPSSLAGEGRIGGAPGAGGSPAGANAVYRPPLAEKPPTAPVPLVVPTPSEAPAPAPVFIQMGEATQAEIIRGQGQRGAPVPPPVRNPTADAPRPRSPRPPKAPVPIGVLVAAGLIIAAGAGFFAWRMMGAAPDKSAKAESKSPAAEAKAPGSTNAGSVPDSGDPNPGGGSPAMAIPGLDAGAKWTGTFRFRPPSNGYVGDVRLDFTERTGDAFRGLYTTENGKYQWKVAGTIKDGKIRFGFTEAVRDNDNGDVVGNAEVEGDLLADRMQAVFHHPPRKMAADLTLRPKPGPGAVPTKGNPPDASHPPTRVEIVRNLVPGALKSEPTMIPFGKFVAAKVPIDDKARYWGIELEPGKYKIAIECPAVGDLPPGMGSWLSLSIGTPFKVFDGAQAGRNEFKGRVVSAFEVTTKGLHIIAASCDRPFEYRFGIFAADATKESLFGENHLEGAAPAAAAAKPGFNVSKPGPMPFGRFVSGRAAAGNVADYWGIELEPGKYKIAAECPLLATQAGQGSAMGFSVRTAYEVFGGESINKNNYKGRHVFAFEVKAKALVIVSVACDVAADYRFGVFGSEIAVETAFEENAAEAPAKKREDALSPAGTKSKPVMLAFGKLSAGKLPAYGDDTVCHFRGVELPAGKFKIAVEFSALGDLPAGKHALARAVFETPYDFVDAKILGETDYKGRGLFDVELKKPSLLIMNLSCDVATDYRAGVFPADATPEKVFEGK